MKKLPAAYQQWVFVFSMTLLMGLTLSFIMTVVERGFGSGLVGAWLSAFARTYVIVVPTVVVVSPLARWFTDRVTESAPRAGEGPDAPNED